MSTILLADDSPHAQRMGERILREEGFDVSSVADEAAALARLADGDPDLVIVDAFLPGSGGLDLCRYVKKFHRHVRVILTAGQLETLDEQEARAAGCDAVLRKPFEASLVIGTIRSLVQEAKLARGLFAEALASARPCRFRMRSRPGATARPTRSGSRRPSPWRWMRRLPNLVREITEKVLVALGH